MKISSSEQWHRIDSIFGEALPLRHGARTAYLDESCSTDPVLRAEVERLLAASDDAGDFLEALDATQVAGLLEPRPETAAIGRYHVIRRIGSGGMGVVYLAEDPSLKRQVAVKLLPPWLDASPAAKHRLIEEARAASAIDHPNVATVHEIGETEDGRLFIAMSYYEGDTLRGRMARDHLTVAEATDIALQTARGLSAAHGKGIVHRDIKPENILVRLDGTVKVLDFGIAAVEEQASRRTATAIGTAAYMSPEQTLASSIDSRSDIWSLGVVIYEMLGRVRPFGGRTRDEIFASITRDPLQMNRHIEHDVPTTLRAIVERCLQKDPAARYQSTEELERDLESARAGAASSGRLRGFVRQHTAGSAMTAGALLTAVALAVYGTWPASRADPSPSTVAIFPFTAGAPDTVLEQLGRDLAATLSGSLDGIGDLHMRDARAAVGKKRRGLARSTNELSAVAHSMGAGIVLTGSIARVGTRVRADGLLFNTTSAAPLARVSATAAPEDIAVLSDSLAWALQRELWRILGLPALAASGVTTPSFPALRAYFDGDRLANEYRMRAAATAFAHAIAADSAFWFAYWRYAWASSFHQLPVDAAITAAYVAHRAEFPVPDRLLIEARMTADLSSRLTLLESLVEQFPDHWPGWFELGELRVRQAPFAGSPIAEAERPLHRAVSLNRRFVPGWDRLLWVAIARRDTALSARALRELEQLHYDSTSVLDDRFDVLLLYRHLHHLARSGGVPDSLLADSVATGLSRTGFRPSVDGMPDRLQSGIARFEFHSARIDQAERMIRTGYTRPWFQWHVIANSLAARGAWDSAFVAVDHGVRDAPNPVSGLHAYRLAAVGVWLGAVTPSVATAWRSRAIGTYDRMLMGDRAELAWIDGLLAYVRQDAAALSRARRELQVQRVPEVGRMDSSLNALSKDLAGKTRDGIQLLLALDQDRFHVSNGHPYLTGVNRITASRWLLAAGDTTRAARLLTWHEAIGNDGPQATHANALLAPFAYLARARIQEAQGHRDAAHAHYARFLSNYDAPVPVHRRLVAEARAALERVSRR